MPIPIGRRLFPVAASIAGAIVCGAILMSTGVTDRGSSASEAVTLPGACANFLHASGSFSREGSSAVVRIAGSSMFARDHQASAVEVLSTLLASCDEELAEGPP